MDYSAFININDLSDEAKKELEVFYEFLIFKDKKRNSRLKNNKKDRLKGFLSKTIKVDQFQMLNREERNER